MRLTLEIVIYDGNGNHADIGVIHADTGSDGLAEREQEGFGGLDIRNIIRNRDGIAIAFGGTLVVGDDLHISSVGIVPDHFSVLLKMTAKDRYI